MATRAIVKTTASRAALLHDDIRDTPQVDIVEEIHFCVAVIVQIQIERADTCRAFNVDPMAAIGHFQLFKGEIITIRRFIKSRISTALKIQTDMIIA